MSNNPLMDFLQNGSSLPNDAVPVNYRIQTMPQPASNPMSFFEKLNPMNWLKEQLQTNPQVQQVMKIVEENGGDAKTAFYNECKKRNADPDQIIQQMKANPLFQRFMK